MSTIVKADLDPTLVLTLALDPISTSRFEELRRRYYPPERNRVPAHVSIFHKLPGGEHEPETLASVSAISQETKRCPLPLVGLRSLGYGWAVFFDESPLLELYAKLRSTFEDVLINQDKQRWRPHLVIQNKVTLAQSRASLPLMEHEALPSVVQAVGLQTWRYQDGYWETLACAFFSDQSPR
jgi:hypothetical protein